jgi:hypothetical protein
VTVIATQATNTKLLWLIKLSPSHPDGRTDSLTNVCLRHNDREYPTCTKCQNILTVTLARQPDFGATCFTETRARVVLRSNLDDHAKARFAAHHALVGFGGAMERIALDHRAYAIEKSGGELAISRKQKNEV